MILFEVLGKIYKAEKSVMQHLSHITLILIFYNSTGFELHFCISQKHFML